MDTVLRQDLIDVALRATDAYLGIEKHSLKNNFATNQDIHDFTFYLSQAHDALTQLGDIDNHADYMNMHLETMMKLAKHDDATIYDLPFTHVSKSHLGAVEESIQLDEEAAKGLAAKAAKSGVSLGTLRKVYSRGVAAWRTGHRPGTTPQQWGMARVNSYITKGKTYHTADKDLREETQNVNQITTNFVKHYEDDPMGAFMHAKSSYLDAISRASTFSVKAHDLHKSHEKMSKEEFQNSVMNHFGKHLQVHGFPKHASQKWGYAEHAFVKELMHSDKTKNITEQSKKKSDQHLTDDDIDDIVKNVDWEDIVHTYDDDELEKEEQLEEKLSPQARIKKQREFTRTGTKRNILLQMKLKRPSSPSQIQKRAVVAARTVLAKRFLQGRTRDQLSPQEKDILEARLKRMRELGIQQIVAQRLVPKIRQIEQKRLKSRR